MPLVALAMPFGDAPAGGRAEEELVLALEALRRPPLLEHEPEVRDLAAAHRRIDAPQNVQRYQHLRGEQRLVPDRLRTQPLIGKIGLEGGAAHRDRGAL